MEEKIFAIADKLFAIMPIIRKKVGRQTLEDPPIINHTHYQILYNLKCDGLLSVSEIGRRLVISKPNMTPLINKLIKVGFARRIPDEKDRRIVNIEITEEGLNYINIRRARHVEHLKKKLSVLPADELDALEKALDTVHTSLSKLQ